MTKTVDGYVIENDKGGFLNENMEWKYVLKVNVCVCKGKLDDIKRLIARYKIKIKKLHKAKNVDGFTLYGKTYDDPFAPNTE